MKQVLQDPKEKRVRVVDVPPPAVQRGRVLVRTAASLISAGTERMTVELGRKGLLGKARERPDLVQQVIQKAKNEGLLNTLRVVRARLSSSTALGYSAAGTIVAVGDGVEGLRVGDRVACAGAGFASHAEVISVPKNLCARVPTGVSMEHAAFSTLGAIALQGVRLAEPALGEAVVVIGLGLLGQLTVQLLKANGCRVFGIDLDEGKVELARSLGADDAAVMNAETQRAVIDWSRGRGADAVLITAATSSNEPIEFAGEIARLRGRVVAVGLVGMNVPRKVYYEKELSLVVSRSYGPGRYDPEYEERGHDYPFAYVRWTEGRNLEAFLDLVAEGRLKLDPLITHRFKIEEAEEAYRLIAGERREPYLGVVLLYEETRAIETRVEIARPQGAPRAGRVRIGLVGAGSYARSMLLPALRAAGAQFQTVATASGISARDVAEKYGFRYCVAGADEVLADEEVDLVVIATRHDLHAELASRALERNRHVFVEKPLALDDEELDQIIAIAKRSAGNLAVGFNRRFSPLAREAKEFFKNRREPLSILYRVNAGRIPREHWVQDAREGGGRIIGEVCHFVDLMQFLTGARPVRVYAEEIETRNHEIICEDSIFITLRFEDGSNGCIAYLAEGDRALPKERIEIFGEGRAFVLDDFRAASAYHCGRERKIRLRNQDKGQFEQAKALYAMVAKGTPPPIPLAELEATTRATFRIRDSLRLRRPIEL